MFATCGNNISTIWQKEEDQKEQKIELIIIRKEQIKK